MSFKAAFIFIAPEVDPKETVHEFVLPAISLTAVGVSNYAAAEKIAAELVDNGVTAIELCAGFGNDGVARITKAVKGKATVGVVRFDNHPGFGFKSGDELF